MAERDGHETWLKSSVLCAKRKQVCKGETGSQDYYKSVGLQSDSGVGCFKRWKN